MKTHIEQLSKIYNGLIDAGCEYPPFEDWVDSITMTFLSQDGGVVLTADPVDNTIWRVQAWFEKPQLSVQIGKTMMVACMEAGCKLLIATATEPRMAILLEQLGWQEVDSGNPKTYAIRCE